VSLTKNSGLAPGAAKTILQSLNTALGLPAVKCGLLDGYAWSDTKMSPTSARFHGDRSTMADSRCTLSLATPAGCTRRCCCAIIPQFTRLNQPMTPNARAARYKPYN